MLQSSGRSAPQSIHVVGQVAVRCFGTVLNGSFSGPNNPRFGFLSYLWVMNEQRALCVAFTGHRNYRGEADAALARTVEELFRAGFRTYLCGMALGFDLAAAEAALSLRERYADVRLVAVVPFPGQAERYPNAERSRYARLVAAADERVLVSERYDRGCYRRRNDFLVAHAAVVVAWYDGSPSGTGYTVGRARRTGCRVIDLWRDPHGLFPGF